MDLVTDVSIHPCTNSKYIKPVRLHYKQNGVSKVWDAMYVHDSVVVIIYNTSRKVLVFVKQFRPAIYLGLTKGIEQDGVCTVDTEKYPGQLGVTFELCAGIIDKDMGPEVIAQNEVLEECGYKVPLERLEKVTTYMTGVGTTGALQYLFYVEVTDEMKVGAGGGLVEEGEMIDVIDIPVSQGRQLILDESVNKPVALMFALMWFFDKKCPRTDQQLSTL